MKSRKIIGQYQNGNYTVYLFNDGTKIRYTEDDEFKPVFPESIDVTCTTSCSMGCQQCYLNCLPNGKHWDYSSIQPLFDTLHPYTELAINGNDFDDIPGLDAFLIHMKQKHILVNATFHFEQYISLVNRLRDYQENNMLHGIGVSVNKLYEIGKLKSLIWCKDVVIHTINGFFNEDIYYALKDSYDSSSKKIKLLILGYKDKGRGKLFKHLYPDDVAKNMKWLNDNIQMIMNDEQFEVVSFDNLALEQLDIQHKVSAEIWETHYMGDDGKFTMYFDAVNMTYAMNSMSENTLAYDPQTNMSISDIFEKVKKYKAIKDAQIEIEQII